MRKQNWRFLLFCVFYLCISSCSSTQPQIIPSTFESPVATTTQINPVQSQTPFVLITTPRLNTSTTFVEISTPITPETSQTIEISNIASNGYFESEELYCKQDGCIYSIFQPLLRPLTAEYEPKVEKTYRYGSTQNGTRESHSGVEFEGKYGTPVIAVADGTVFYAGNDENVVFGPYKNFYGNLIILEHTWKGLSQPVYTVYAHLSDILVNTGDVIESGQEIAKIGNTGSATGPHLHFEVRIGNTEKNDTVNPELWLKPANTENEFGEVQCGTLIVRFITGTGTLSSAPVLIENFTDTNLDRKPYIDAESYSVDAITDKYWNESLVVGDLTPGIYRISVTKNNRSFKKFIEIESERITLVEFDFVN